MVTFCAHTHTRAEMGCEQGNTQRGEGKREHTIAAAVSRSRSTRRSSAMVRDLLVRDLSVQEGICVSLSVTGPMVRTNQINTQQTVLDGVRGGEGRGCPDYVVISLGQPCVNVGRRETPRRMAGRGGVHAPTRVGEGVHFHPQLHRSLTDELRDSLLPRGMFTNTFEHPSNIQN